MGWAYCIYGKRRHELRVLVGKFEDRRSFENARRSERVILK
jgi:hypothetical protein